MVGGRRVPLAEHAERVNAAAELLAADVPVAAAARGLAERFGVSTRQARRYAEQAAGSGRAPVPEARVVFTVKLPASLADRVRERAPTQRLARRTGGPAGSRPRSARPAPAPPRRPARRRPAARRPRWLARHVPRAAPDGDQP